MTDPLQLAETAGGHTRPASPPVSVRWIALRDGLGHAYAGRKGPAVCGVTRPDERYAWPVRTKCPTCWEEVQPRRS